MKNQNKTQSDKSSRVVFGILGFLAGVILVGPLINIGIAYVGIVSGESPLWLELLSLLIGGIIGVIVARHLTNPQNNFWSIETATAKELPHRIALAGIWFLVAAVLMAIFIYYADPSHASGQYYIGLLYSLGLVLWGVLFLTMSRVLARPIDNRARLTFLLALCQYVFYGMIVVVVAAVALNSGKYYTYEIVQNVVIGVALIAWGKGIERRIRRAITH